MTAWRPILSGRTFTQSLLGKQHEPLAFALKNVSICKYLKFFSVNLKWLGHELGCEVFSYSILNALGGQPYSSLNNLLK